MNQVCKEFLSNPNTNPRTGRTIKKGGPVYTSLMKECRAQNLILPAPKMMSPKMMSPKMIPKMIPKTISPKGNNRSDDHMAFEIFSTINDKYIKGFRIFETERTKITNLRASSQITEIGYLDIMNIINLYEVTYTQFIDNVTNNRIFVEKASSGKPPRKLITGQDWGEAIIELNNLVDIFRRDLQIGINVHLCKETLQKECKTLGPEKCSSPCKIKTPIFRTAYCDLP